jgi:hypothetical protein
VTSKQISNKKFQQLNENTTKQLIKNNLEKRKQNIKNDENIDFYLNKDIQQSFIQTNKHQFQDPISTYPFNELQIISNTRCYDSILMETRQINDNDLLIVPDGMKWNETSTSTNSQQSSIECIDRTDIRSQYLKNPSFTLHECKNENSEGTRVRMNNMTNNGEPAYARLPVPFPFYLYKESLIKLLDQLDEQYKKKFKI